MCGIAGILSLSEPLDNSSIVRRMTNMMAHRGPNFENFYEGSNVSLGHRRLCIIDLSDAANQPFSDCSGRYTIVFNGEIYNFKELKSKINNYDFITQGDTEVLLAAYIKWGADSLEYIKGMFAFAIWDDLEKRLFIARDRFGVKPLYYYIKDKKFIFSSELRALLASGLIPRKINPKSVYQFLSFQSVGYPLTPISGVNQIEAGSYITVDSSGVRYGKYWDITKKPELGFDFSSYDEIKKRTKHLLYESVERRMISDVPLGAFLSGGIDSSSVVGIMSEISDKPVNTFSVGFYEKKFDESDFAREIATRFKTNHNSIMVSPQVFLEELTNALNAMDSPSGDGINTYVVSKKIRESGLIVALSGIGGDELFAGYPFFKRFSKLKKFNSTWSYLKALRTIASYFIPNSSRGERIKNILNSRSNDIRFFYPEFRRVISQTEVSKLINIEGLLLSDIDKEIFSFPDGIDDFPILSQVSIAEYLGYTQHTLLKDTDQMSMAVSLEVREPFFDSELVEFVLQVPDKYKTPTYPKKLLVDSLEGLLPEQIYNRRKQGFTFPFNIWMKDQLRSFCEEKLIKMAQRDFVDGNSVMLHWNKFIKGDKSINWMELWLLVVLEYWMDKNHIE